MRSCRPYFCVLLFVRSSQELAELCVVVATSFFHFLSHLLSLPLLTLLLQRTLNIVCRRRRCSFSFFLFFSFFLVLVP